MCVTTSRYFGNFWKCLWIKFVYWHLRYFKLFCRLPQSRKTNYKKEKALFLLLKKWQIVQFSVMNLLHSVPSIRYFACMKFLRLQLQTSLKLRRNLKVGLSLNRLVHCYFVHLKLSTGSPPPIFKTVTDKSWLLGIQTALAFLPDSYQLLIKNCGYGNSHCPTYPPSWNFRKLYSSKIPPKFVLKLWQKNVCNTGRFLFQISICLFNFAWIVYVNTCDPVCVNRYCKFLSKSYLKRQVLGRNSISYLP